MPYQQMTKRQIVNGIAVTYCHLPYIAFISLEDIALVCPDYQASKEAPPPAPAIEVRGGSSSTLPVRAGYSHVITLSYILIN